MFSLIQVQVMAGVKTRQVIEDINRWRPFRLLWRLLEYPESSGYAKCYASLSVFIITLSIVMLIIESIPQTTDPPHDVNMTVTSSHNVSEASKDRRRMRDVFFQSYEQVVLPLNTFIIVWFSTEFLLRFISCPDKMAFWKTFGNLVDLVSVLPYFIGAYSLIVFFSTRQWFLAAWVRLFRRGKLSWRRHFYVINHEFLHFHNQSSWTARCTNTTMMERLGNL